MVSSETQIQEAANISLVLLEAKVYKQSLEFPLGTFLYLW